MILTVCYQVFHLTDDTQSLGRYFYLPSELDKSLQAREADVLTF